MIHKINKGYFFDTLAEYKVWLEKLTLADKQKWKFTITQEPKGVRVLYEPNTAGVKRNEEVIRIGGVNRF